MVFGQVVIGPPGSGKTTYCNGMSQFLQLVGRKVAVINLDPTNDSLPYDCAINIEDLIKRIRINPKSQTVPLYQYLKIRLFKDCVQRRWYRTRACYILVIAKPEGPVVSQYCVLR